MGQAGLEAELMGHSQSIQPIRKQLAPAKPAPPAKPAAPQAPKDSMRVVCSKCQNAMRIPFAVLRGKTSLNVSCPQCKNVMTLRAKPANPSPQP
jgi:hypothetical protein